MATKKTAKKPKVTPVAKKFWAMLLYYVPFVMGGATWQPRRYEVAAEAVKIGRFRCFVWLNDVSMMFHVNEVTTGGLLADASSREAAIDLARSNIAMTPDLHVQMAKFGDVMNHAAVPKDEALRRGQKGKRR